MSLETVAWVAVYVLGVVGMTTWAFHRPVHPGDDLEARGAANVIGGLLWPLFAAVLVGAVLVVLVRKAVQR